MFQNKSVTFNVVNMTDKSNISFNYFIRLLLDDGVKNNVLGIHYFKVLSLYVRTTWHEKLDPLPAQFEDRIHWKMALAVTKVILSGC